MRFLIQAYIASRIEPRKRREDRWEEDVRRLGEFLAFDFTEATDRLMHARWWIAYLRQAEDGGAEISDATQREADGEFQKAKGDYSAVRGRLNRLVERVTHIGLGRSDLNRLWRESALRGSGWRTVPTGTSSRTSRR